MREFLLRTTLAVCLLIVMLFNIQAKASTSQALNIVQDIMEAIKTTGSIKPLEEFMVNGVFRKDIATAFAKNGELKSFKCLYNHESKVFFGIVCHVIYTKHNSGNSWTLMVFKDGNEFVGTQLILSPMFAESDQCVSNLKLETGVGKDFSFDVVKCDE